jgi:hypothetical protein
VVAPKLPGQGGSPASWLTDDVDPLEAVAEPIETEYRAIGEPRDPDADDGEMEDLVVIGETIDADCADCEESGSSALPEGRAIEVGEPLDADAMVEEGVDPVERVHIGEPLDAGGDGDP